MKVKLSEWGNSQGIRITGPMLEHLKVAPGDEINITLTDNGIEIAKNAYSQKDAKNVAQEAIDGILATTEPVKTVDDPYAESNDVRKGKAISL